MPLNYAEIELQNEIMSTDTYIYASSMKAPESKILRDLEQAVKILKAFEKRFSRFIQNNELDIFNKSEEIIVSNDLFEILFLCKKYYKKTDGVFNPTIINTLVNSGYSKTFQSLNKDQPVNEKLLNDKIFSMDEIKIDQKTKSVSKPKNLHIDLGGIGKSFVVEKVSKFLSNKYESYCVNAGGDMYLYGEDTLNKHPYWAIQIENPISSHRGVETPTLIVKDKGICTSGVNRKRWMLNGITKNHLIDPFEKGSVENEIASATVISEDIIEADVYAKSLVIMGKERATEFSKENSVASVIITKDQEIIISSKANEYI